ncbi:MAG: nicotinate phosphoribosyltransferase [Akkermansiaceae bacterium]|nr:nicotinate phosphoribosyltransferase [Armatimonadota bacterium]
MNVTIDPSPDFTPLILSLLDNDFYKITMMRVAFERFPAAQAKYRFVCRTKGVDLRPMQVALREQIDYLADVSFSGGELSWLRQFSYLSRGFVDGLRTFRLVADDVSVGERDGQLEVLVEGPWWRTILWEVPILALISELYHQSEGHISPEIAAEGMRRAEGKLGFLKAQSDQPDRFRVIDMGTRRRFSGAWQRQVIANLSGVLPGVFVGTSNMLLAKNTGLRLYGTMAHEYLSAFQALVHPADSQRVALDTWMDVYRGDLGVALTDTIGMDAFFRDFDKKLALSFSGCRQDSGDPHLWGRRLIDHYKSLGIDAKTKTAVFSDNLDIPKAFALYADFADEINLLFGIGTNLTNDLGTPRLSIVMKLVALNDRPVAKISDEPAKAICDDPLHLEYLKHVYGVTVPPSPGHPLGTPLSFR